MMMPMAVEEGVETVQLYVVVNHSFSRALGPFSSAGQAGSVAMKLTKESKKGSKYVPVPLITLGPVHMVEMGDHEGHNHGAKDVPDRITRMQNMQYL